MGQVVLLGAGFSKAISNAMPTLAELGSRVLTELGPEHSHDLDPFDGDLEAYLSYIGADQPWLSDENNLRNRALFSETVIAVRDVIVHAEAQTSRDGVPEWLARLAWQWSRDRTSILTFNYDTLLEEPLRMASRAGTLADLYMVPIVERQAPGWGSMFSTSGPQKSPAELFKMHGSVNWLHGGEAAPVTDPLILRYPDNDGEALPRSSRIYGGLRPFIVPPTSVKNRYYDRVGLRAQWQTAADRLQAADRLTVIGYSLPATDVGSTSFLQTNLDAEAIVEVVDPCADVASRFREVVQRDVHHRASITDWLPTAVADFVEWWVTDENSDQARAHVRVNGVERVDKAPIVRDRAELEEWRRAAMPDLLDVELNGYVDGSVVSHGWLCPVGDRPAAA
ncbi:hypothetical protein [uncultured Amnibacterium sp.]|uniref:hypothetical protein n=1 Tax=uncultured Amnibacterium sp. TaxID=1631851 RepID=UPI0035CAF84B